MLQGRARICELRAVPLQPTAGSRRCVAVLFVLRNSLVFVVGGVLLLLLEYSDQAEDLFVPVCAGQTEPVLDVCENVASVFISTSQAAISQVSTNPCTSSARSFHCNVI